MKKIISYRKETFVEIKELYGEEYFLDLSEFATEVAMMKRPVGYKYRLVSTLDHVGEVIKHNTSNCFRPVEPEKLVDNKPEETKREMKWYQFNDLKVNQIDAKHAVTRDAAGFIFELVEDEKYDQKEHDDNIREWRKRHGKEEYPVSGPGEDSEEQVFLLEAMSQEIEAIKQQIEDKKRSI